MFQDCIVTPILKFPGLFCNWIPMIDIDIVKFGTLVTLAATVYVYG